MQTASFLSLSVILLLPEIHFRIGDHHEMNRTTGEGAEFAKAEMTSRTHWEDRSRFCWGFCFRENVSENDAFTRFQNLRLLRLWWCWHHSNLHVQINSIWNFFLECFFSTVKAGVIPKVQLCPCGKFKFRSDSLLLVSKNSQRSYHEQIAHT